MDLKRRLGSLLAVFSVVAALAGVPLLAAAPGAAAAAPASYQAPGTPSPSVAGATTPFTTYEAPEGALGGGASVVSLTSAPTSEYDSPQGEADGHAYVPSNAVDGNTSTYWESTDNDFPQWLQVDLGSSVAVGRIVMDLPPSSAWGTRTQTITVQGSADGSTYSTLTGSAGYTFNPSTGNTVTVTFPAASVRYVRLTFTANTGWPAGQLSELQVYPS